MIGRSRVFCISSKGHHATRILVLLASQNDDRLLTKQEIAESTGVTPGYVQQLMMPLQTAGLIRSHRGKQGGYSLGRRPETITVADTLFATEGEMRLAPCYDGGHCDQIETCPIRPVWVGATALLYDFLQQTSIAALAEKGRDVSVTPEPVLLGATAPLPGGAKGIEVCV